MYNAAQIKAFINKANAEAEAAAQAVYDKYEPELLERIKKQLHKDDILYIGNGTATIDRKNKTISNDFIDEVGDTQYTKIEAGFSLPYITTK